MKNRCLRVVGLSCVLIVVSVGSVFAEAILPVEVESFPSPCKVDQMEYAHSRGLLFLRNSEAAIYVIDTRTRALVDVHY
ncbi:MAG TPA: hypothetical protein VM186_01140, partial [Planctomycetota bacterium]|nr:hypothetical protein [Planctomycetota bacterium]